MTKTPQDCISKSSWAKEAAGNLLEKKKEIYSDLTLRMDSTQKANRGVAGLSQALGKFLKYFT